MERSMGNYFPYLFIGIRILKSILFYSTDDISMMENTTYLMYVLYEITELCMYKIGELHFTLKIIVKC